MSVTLMGAAWKLDIGATDKIVLLALADRADDDGKCWPGIASLARKCGLSERSVQRSIQELVTGGHLSRQDKPGVGCIYSVHPRQAVTPDTASPVTDATEAPDSLSPNTSRTITKRVKATPSPSARAQAVKGFNLPDDIPADAFAGFAEMRRKIGHPLTPRAAELAVAKLRELSDGHHPPGAVLDQSTMNGWRGLFEIKEQGNGRNGRTEARQHGPTPRVSAALEFVGVH